MVDNRLFWIFFDPFFIKLVVQFNYYLVKNIQFIILFIVLYKLIFDIFFQISFEYIHQYNIILFDIINLLLEFRNILCCRLYLLYFLNFLFRDFVFIDDTENSANLFFENFSILEKYFDIDIIRIF